MTTTAQLHHLWAASHALAATSPAVSAHLMTKLFKVSCEKDINLAETTSRQVCTACGTVAIPGVNSHVHTSRNHRKKRKTSKRAEAKGKNLGLSPGKQSGDQITRPQKISKLRMIYECQTCGRSRSQDVPPSKPRSSSRARSRPAANLTVQSPSSTTPAEAQKSTTPITSQNASSKKRAKSRKGNSLSDMLAAKRKQDSLSGARGNGIGGFGLDLMDLMKTS